MTRLSDLGIALDVASAAAGVATHLAERLGLDARFERAAAAT